MLRQQKGGLERVRAGGNSLLASRTSTHGIHSVPLVNTQSLVLKSSVMAGRDESQSPPRTPAAAAGGAADGCCWRAGCCGVWRAAGRSLAGWPDAVLLPGLDMSWGAADIAGMA